MEYIFLLSSAIISMYELLASTFLSKGSRNMFEFPHLVIIWILIYTQSDSYYLLSVLPSLWFLRGWPSE
jgi:hypothetical protein